MVMHVRSISLVSNEYEVLSSSVHSQVLNIGIQKIYNYLLSEFLPLRILASFLDFL
jgi:hypothetical protein